MATINGDNNSNVLGPGPGTDNDSITGLGGNDVLYGGSGSDSLYGGNDNDTLYGGIGSDRLYGGLGNDLLFAGNSSTNDNDSLDGGGGSDTVSYIESTIAVTITLGAGGNATVDPAGNNPNTDTLVGIENIIGSTLADNITGDTVGNILAGEAGNDTIRGGDGNDTLYGGVGLDNLRGDAGADVVYGGDGNDTLAGDDGNDTIFGGADIDSLRGNLGDDLLIGGAGADIIDGDDGIDTASYAGSTVAVNVTINAVAGNTGGDAQGDQLFEIENLTGSDHNDILTGDAGNNVISGGAGRDLVNGGAGNDTLLGDSGIDTIYGGAGNDSIDGGTEGDTLYGDAGNDTIIGGTGTDSIFGGFGNDSIDGAADADTIDSALGNDTIAGGGGDDLITAGPATGPSGAAVPLDFNWTGVGLDGTAITGAGVTQNTGGVNVNVVLTNPGDNFQRFEVETGAPIFFAPGETFNPNSAGWLARNNNGAPTVVDINFSGVPGAGFNDTVQDVRFRISDIDQLDGAWRDRIIVRAYDANGNLIPGGVVFTETSADISTSGSTITADFDAGNTSPDQLEGSVLVTVAGPVARIEVVYDNLATTQQFIYLSDIQFNAIPTPDNDSVTGGDGNDTIYGGIGNDTLVGGNDRDVLYGGEGADFLSGGTGNDTLFGGAGTDTMSGDAGNDIFVIADNAEVSAAGNDVIFGGGNPGEGIGTDFDVIDLSTIGTDRIDVVYTNTDPLNLVGTISIYQPGLPHIPANLIGVISFSEIERVILCFTPGTMILTDRGEIAVEALLPGDMVMTRDNGLQPLRWTGKRQLSAVELQANPDLQPVRIAAGAFAGEGPARTMLVSPQHRIMIEGARAELLFGESEVLVPAKHLVGQIDATRALPSEGVTYIHILFDSHEIVKSDGIWTESFQPAERTLSAMEAEVRDEILALFPTLATNLDAYVGARLSLKAHEAKVLLAG